MAYEDKCNCNDYKTTYQVFYKKPCSATKQPPAVNIQEDPCLINGEFLNNLLVNNKPIPYKVVDHPLVKDHHEEIKCYLAKLPQQDQNIYCKYFADQNSDFAIAKRYLENRNRSCYSQDYSPDGTYVPRRSDIQFVRMPGSNLNYELTVYRDSYNRIKELQDLKEFLKVHKFCDEARKRALQDELQRIYKVGQTTYVAEISEPAKIQLNLYKKRKLLKEGPLDPHTLRQI